MANATLTFLGAAGTVTGSKYLLTLDDRRVLVDGGMFQGEKEWRERNWDPFPVDPGSITDLILTHAHADHSAYIPALVKKGFRGPIWCTEGTRRLAEIVLRDAAHLQEQTAKEANEGGYSKHSPALPLYTGEDVEKTIPLFRVVPFDTPIDLGGGLVAQYTRAGHILGSASVDVQYEGTSVLFSGDLGRKNHPILKPRGNPPGAPVVLIESTYGDREHPADQTHEKMADAIRRTVARGGSVLIPAFAIDRTELVLKTLAEMRRDGRIPSVPIWVNSPMALSALDAYRGLPDEIRDDVRMSDFANLSDLHEARTVDDSKAITDPHSKMQPSIIVSSSGMATGGRVVHHLADMLPDAENAVILTGYQGVGTRGRSLIEGAKQLKMFGKYVPVRAEIVQDSEFSVHADSSDLLDWLRALKPAPQTVFVTHGEEGSAEAFAALIQKELGVTTVVPSYGEVVRLDAAGGGYEVLTPGEGDGVPAPVYAPPTKGRRAAEPGAPDGFDPSHVEKRHHKATRPAGAPVPALVPVPAAGAVAASERLRYRLLTGPDDASFCERVSAALAEGYELYGSPSVTFDGRRVIAAQAVVLPGDGEERTL